MGKNGEKICENFEIIIKKKHEWVSEQWKEYYLSLRVDRKIDSLNATW